MIEDILYGKIKVINEIIPMLNNKSLDDLVNLLNNDLKILGNAKIKVKLSCAYCNNDCIRTLKFYFKDRIYCNIQCRDNYRKENFSNKNSPCYQRIKTRCNNCNKIIQVSPYKLNQKNSYGDNHNFCSRQCYYEYRHKYYIKEKHPMFQHQYPKQQIINLRNAALKRLSDKQIPSKLTNPHKTINYFLDSNNIVYQNEYTYKYYSVDVYLQSYNLIIEIMGDYWHGSPIKYKYKDLNDIQLKDVKRDKSKHTYIKKYYNIEILYLWEYDINNNFDMCCELIKLYIHNKGNLINYNSFNYSLTDNKLKLNDNVIQPYFINTKCLTTAG